MSDKELNRTLSLSWRRERAGLKQQKSQGITLCNEGLATYCLGNVTPSPPSKLSFKDKLVGEIPGAYTQAFNFTAHMDTESDSDEEIDEVREFAAINLSKETKQRIRVLWSRAIIIKVFGRIVGFTFLHTKIIGLWKPTGKIDMVDLG